MDILRKFLIRLRKEYYADVRKFYIRFGGVAAVLAIVTLLADWLLPFGGWGTLVRSFLLVPTAVAIFSTAYGLSLYLHEAQLRANEDWRPYRARFSPRWRLQISAVVGALLFVFAYASTRGVGYTLTSSIIGAVIVALFAFVRTTREESKRVKLGIPDARDVAYDARRRQYERDLQAKKDAKERKKKEKA